MSDDPKNPRSPQGGDPFGDDDAPTPEEQTRWQRPTNSPRDRFPMLPDEEPETAALKEPPRRPAAPPVDPGAKDRTRNLITAFFLLASCALITYFGLLWQNPYTSLNPLAPPTPLPVVITATYTPTFTLTPAPTLTPSQTYTPSPIPTFAPSLTFTPIFMEGFSTEQSPLATALPPDQQGDFPFTLQHDHVIYITNPDARGGCNWSSIAGSVMNYDGSALNGYGVHVVGEGVDQTVATGSAPGFGPGGFEVPLGSVARDAQFVAQLLDTAGNPASPVYTVETRSECDLNIAALRFVAVNPPS